MARFRPSRLFRRLSSRSSTHTNKDPDPTPPSTANPSTPPPPLPIYSVSGVRQLRKSSSLPKLRKKLHASVADTQARADVPEVVPEQRESVLVLPDGEDTCAVSETTHSRPSESDTLAGERKVELDDEDKEAAVSTAELQLEQVASQRAHPVLTVEQPTPDAEEGLSNLKPGAARTESDRSRGTESGEITLANSTPEQESAASVRDEPSPRTSVFPAAERPETAKPTRPTGTNIRSLSIADSANAKILTTLLDAPTRHEIGLPTAGSSLLPTSGSLDFFDPGIQGLTNMLHRKVWVKRPGASPTLVQIKEDDLVDDARDTILRKYANSLGKTFDPPDMVLHIVTRAEQGQNRTQRALGPEEEMCKTIDSYFPGGQTVDEALVIDTPQRRTPKPSPRVMPNQAYHALDEYRPLENGTDYFPPMPAVIPASIPQTSASNDSRASHHHHPVVGGTAEHPRSISVLNTGQIAPLPSPGGTTRRHHTNRPKYARQQTSSPTVLSHPNAGAVAVNAPQTAHPNLPHRASTRPRMDSSTSEAHHPNGVPAPPPLPTPPAPDAAPTNQNHSQPPTPGAVPPGIVHRAGRPKKTRKPTPESQMTAYGRRKKDSSSSSPHPATSGVGLLDGSVPPINVLIVEDNIINLRILEGLMKRLKVRWQTALNGQIAVDKWKAGGFHLVLMDIQMPVMTGLQATREIRRLERVNGIGVFSSTSPDGEALANGDKPTSDETDAAAKRAEDDKLLGHSEGLFKSPIIIVALTASSLQSDRHEALAAGCNDFLTKPVNFVWLERKVKEWGCMQALIDFDGWRKWKNIAETAEAGKSEAEKAKDREREEKERVKAEKMARLQERQAAKAKEERERKKRSSIGGAGEVGASARAGSPVPEAGAGPSTGTQTLRSGREVLGEVGFELA
ncbi:Two-component response regulator SSK1p [Saxophila tyrrhenica]|uniref:Two-component response regulator SSK1p n=1 Tax=Saxophila tyrrhenica TaxID=1690608 RepID=A0AAV9PAH4_9PEZI|nr:Two-component response regulator SSK1p [Saxophila tyrrhenica]